MTKKDQIVERVRANTKEKRALLEAYQDEFFKHPSVVADKLHENRPLVLEYLSILVQTLPPDMSEEQSEAIRDYFDGTADNTDELIALLDILDS